MTLFLYFFFLGSVTGVSSDTVVCKAYVPPFPVLSVMGKVLGSRVLFALLFLRLAAAPDLVVLLLGGFSDFHALQRCAFDHEVSATAPATEEQCSGMDLVIFSGGFRWLWCGDGAVGLV
ncbi:hypothetical protein P8452_09020 [Trifolium repens]|jgi:hypothetical protein|nr:hypothetical protein QL285_052295 [Trifolium repens]WJX19308.1 hypothetical protein P8452_09020 [Trifolium repens]